MSLITKLMLFARSPQGRKMSQKAMRYAQSPEGKRRIGKARERVATKRKPLR